ncbi:OmpA family protein [Aerophototrophica crusticola]|uniref:OmpA family protein n=1 Tax=Aerophototrophica crusticola TaxID=1709002 RepID=A0A858R410_9PROT|nr:OmpA family protein [Rhodospirillaceae bacterium B3]
MDRRKLLLACVALTLAPLGAAAAGVSPSSHGLTVPLRVILPFGHDRIDLGPEALVAVEEQARTLVRDPALAVRLEGHADDTSSPEYAIGLGQRRADAVKTRLQALGIAPNRITTMSYGRERPAVPGDSPEARAQNRRVEMVIQ